VPGEIYRAHAALPQQRFDVILAIERLADERAGILFQNLSVLRAKAYAVVVFFVTD
jgi:hypothetical protein